MSAALKALMRGGAAPADPQFANTVLLLHGDGTNGAQNNTFIDSSSNNFTITRNGNATQGTFSPFSKEEGKWGNAFDGSGDYLTAQASSGVLGTNDFTIEFWYRSNTAITTATNVGLIGQYSAATANSWGCKVTNQSNACLSFAYYDTTYRNINGTANPNDTAWHHCAFTRVGTTLRIYMDGVLDTTGTLNTNVNFGSGLSNLLNIGRIEIDSVYTNGTVSNLRILVGTALYTGSTYAVPTSPLTAITNTVLLTCQSNRFKDNSSNNFTITPNGDVKITPFSPFANSAAWSASVNGGSGYFDGGGDYLTVANNAAFKPGASGDFCVEMFMFPTGTVATDTALIGNYRVTSYPTNTDGWDILYLTTTKVAFRWGYPNYADSGAWSVNIGQWNHIVVCRNSTNLSMFVNGTRVWTTTSNINVTDSGDASFWVGWAGSISGSTVNPFPGHLSNVRIVKGGTAPYSATETSITVPTAPLTAVPNTSLLLNFTNAAIYDQTGTCDLETVGNAQISTSVKKYGTGSMAFDGTDDILSVPASANLTLGSGDFTVEYWVYHTSFYNYISLVATNRAATGFNCGSQGAAQIVWYANGAERVRGTTTLSANTWYHIAFVRYNGTLKGYVNGVQDGTTYADTINYTNPILYIGSRDGPLEHFTGYIDDLRISRYARYTANFTPPTGPFPDN